MNKMYINQLLLVLNIYNIDIIHLNDALCVQRQPSDTCIMFSFNPKIRMNIYCPQKVGDFWSIKILENCLLL